MKADINEAERLEENESWLEAASIWQRLALEHASVDTLVRLGRALSKGGRVEAEDVLRRAIAMDNEDPRPYFILGIHFETHDRLAEAQEALQQGLARTESQPILTILGWVLLDQAEVKGAETTFRRSLALNGQDDEAHFGLGVAIKEIDRTEAAVHLRQAIQIDPALPGVHRELGYVLLHLDDLDGAEGALRLAVSQQPDDAWAHYLLGQTLSLKRDFASARTEFEKATELEPSNGPLWSSLADVYFWLGLRNEAEATHLRALSADVSNLNTNLKYGLFLKNTSRPKKAAHYLKRVLDKNPSDERAAKAMKGIAN